MKRRSILAWWYDLTIPQQWGKDYIAKEVKRRARLTSTVLFTELAFVILGMVPAIEANNFSLLLILFIMSIALCLCGVANRAGYTTQAGFFTIGLSELGLVAALLITSHGTLDSYSISFLGFLIDPILLAAMLFPPWVILATTVGNDLLICCLLLLFPHTPDLELLLHTQIAGVFIRPISVISVPAMIIFFLMRNSNQTILSAEAELLQKSYENSSYETSRHYGEKE